MTQFVCQTYLRHSPNRPVNRQQFPKYKIILEKGYFLFFKHLLKIRDTKVTQRFLVNNNVRIKIVIMNKSRYRRVLSTGLF